MASDFTLSRIYAQGWAAAGKLTEAQNDAALDAQGLAALNPYKSEIERARWRAGFEQALGKPDAAPGRKPIGFKPSPGGR